MTKCTLNFWTKGGIIRIYVNDGEKTIGYVQRNTSFSSRGTSNDYDRHRVAKGDTRVVTRDEISWTLDDSHVNKIVSAIISNDDRYAYLEDRGHEDAHGRMDLFQALKTFSKKPDFSITI